LEKKNDFIDLISENIEKTVSTILDCLDEDKEKVMRVFNIWVKDKIFNNDALMRLSAEVKKKLAIL